MKRESSRRFGVGEDDPEMSSPPSLEQARRRAVVREVCRRNQLARSATEYKSVDIK